MKVNLNKAVTLFYPNPSFEQVYFEAVANAFDAGANEIAIAIDIEAFEKVETLQITIHDNGKGFTEENFTRFSSLLDSENAEHKGLGRLVFLSYFREVEVVSFFDNHRKRSFRFASNFGGDSDIEEVEQAISGTTMVYRNFTGQRLNSYGNLIPKKLKESLLQQFFPLFFQRKQDDRPFTIKIELKTNTPKPDYEFFSYSTILSLDEIPDLEQFHLRDPTIDLVEGIDIYYRIGNDTAKPKSILTALCVDGRTHVYNLIEPEYVPGGHQIIFLFTSSLFRGASDPARQHFAVPSNIPEKALKQALKAVVGRIIGEKIPAIGQQNTHTREEIGNRYPHLEGYFPEDSIGLIVRSEFVEEAQKRFFNDQKIVLECDDLDDERYEKAVAVSARVLMEYILHRTQIMKKLKAMNAANTEGAMHDLIVPRRRTLRRREFDTDIYNNNVWMLDDKYMSYTAVLSDEEMNSLIQEIAPDETGDESRPDIALVFSDNPATAPKLDIVVVELKRHGVTLANKEEVVSQLKQRARRLLKHYPDKINRIWFYGITDIDSEFKLSLREEGFKELFSLGSMFYKPQPIYLEEGGMPFHVDLYVLTYETFIRDAEQRNETFLRILKRQVKESRETSNPADEDTGQTNETSESN